MSETMICAPCLRPVIRWRDGWKHAGGSRSTRRTTPDPMPEARLADGLRQALAPVMTGPPDGASATRAIRTRRSTPCRRHAMTDSPDVDLFLVDVPGSAEDSTWFVVAANAQDAADRYLRAARAETICVDEDEMEDLGTLRVIPVPRRDDYAPGPVPWDPDAMTRIPVSALPGWTDRG